MILKQFFPYFHQLDPGGNSVQLLLLLLLHLDFTAYILMILFVFHNLRQQIVCLQLSLCRFDILHTQFLGLLNIKANDLVFASLKIRS